MPVRVAFDRPVVCLIGPNDPNYTNYGLEHQVVIRKDLDCSPCQRKVCPIDHRCMTRLLPERVLGEARAALGSPDWVGSLELELRPGNPRSTSRS